MKFYSTNEKGTVPISKVAQAIGFTDNQMLLYLMDSGVKLDNPDEVSAIIANKVFKKFNTIGDLYNNRTGLERIIIINLFGKESYDIKFDNAINIWVSENGVGKTTILNIIVAVLNNDYRTLSQIQFDKVILYYNGKRAVIKKDNERFDVDLAIRILQEYRMYFPPARFFSLLEEVKNGCSIEYIYHILRRYVPISDIDKNKLFRGFSNGSVDQNSQTFVELNKISAMTRDKVVFYPTYRRIESSFTNIGRRERDINYDELFPYLKFGMKDVQERIDNLLSKLRIDANTAYAEMSGEIINDLLENKVENSVSKIDKHKVDVIIKRIGDQRIKNVEKLRSLIENKPQGDKEIFLKFFLKKLCNLYDLQEAVNERLSGFASVCSKYLTNKTIVYDEALLTMKVINTYGEEIGLEELSSGEKQIVSIFSKVYLDTMTPNIFIIDEPEISLSIKWQRDFLVDIMNSRMVGLLIATTHSPFIFKNNYRAYTREIECFQVDSNELD